MTVSFLSLAPLFALALSALGPAVPQTPGAVPAARDTSDTFHDATARRLLESARTRWAERERAILSYEALIRHRMAVHLRTPLKDRTLYRAEAAARVHWSADSAVVVQVLAARETHPGGTEPPESFPGMVEEVFDPASDRMYFGFTSDEDGRDDGDDVWIEHPVAPGSERFYRYRTGDTLTLSLPDGRSLRTVELEIVPREPSVHLVSGALWIEPESGALVRALYRLSRSLDLERDTDELEDDDDLRRLPGIFRPLEFDVSMVAVDYSLWSLRYWLPRRMRIEGTARAGIVRAPGAYEISYRILDVEGVEEPSGTAEAAARGNDPSRASATDGGEEVEEVVRGWTGQGPYGRYEELAVERRNEGRRTRILLPVDRTRLHTSEHLPPPIWEDAPGFASEAELRDLYEELADQPTPVAAAGSAWGLRWGLQRPDLVRYNRVEGLSLGARIEGATARPSGRVDVRATARLGLGTWVPGGELEVEWTGDEHRLSLAGYHRVSEVDPRARNLGLGNSATALLFGRDDGDYFRATGGRIEWSPAGVRRPLYRLVLSAEEHAALPAMTDFAVSGLVGGDPEPFRRSLDAEPGREYAAALQVEPWWGTDPRGFQGGLEAMLQGGAGDRGWVRARLVGRLAAPLHGGLRAALEAGGGTLRGRAPIQRHWFLGGTRTLRGYPGASAVGRSYLRARLELARELSAARVSAFSDAGWAGDRTAFATDDVLVSAGVGASVLDGLVRFDLARALRAPTGWRVELYLDAVL